jgi:hypothetical protein
MLIVESPLMKYFRVQDRTTDPRYRLDRVPPPAPTTNDVATNTDEFEEPQCSIFL